MWAFGLTGFREVKKGERKIAERKSHDLSVNSCS